MSLRIPSRLTSVFRTTTQQTSCFHTTSIQSAFRTLPTSTTTNSSRSSTSNLLNLDNDSPSSSSRPGPRKQSSHDALASMLRSSDSSSGSRITRRARPNTDSSSISARTRDELQSREVADRFSRMMPRFWREGDVYSPQDLGAYEARKFRGQKGQAAKNGDVMDLLGVNPKDLYRVSFFFPVLVRERWGMADR